MEFKKGDKVRIKAGAHYGITKSGSEGIILVKYKNYDSYYGIDFYKLTGYSSGCTKFDIYGSDLEFIGPKKKLTFKDILDSQAHSSANKND